MTTATERLLIISSDGHAGALMQDYREYLDPAFRDEFDDFLVTWHRHGSRQFDPPALNARLDARAVAEWTTKMVETGRIDGYADPQKRITEAEKEGIAAEVLFPDFGIPFELYSPSLAAARGHPLPDDDHMTAAFRAFNRWLSDFISSAPERFVGMGLISWTNVERAVADIRAAHDGGLKGIVLPAFAPELPVFHEVFEPIWNTLDELSMVVNSHAGISSTSNRTILTPGLPHAALQFRIWAPEMKFLCHNLLSHLIWGGVLERHPGLTFAFTEEGSDWIVGELAGMDYTYTGSYYRSDYKHLIRSKPSEYFERQCFLGSSTFSLSEIRNRHEIGLGKMMLGMDFPHHEGTVLQETTNYLRATLGQAEVPLAEAQQMLFDNAASVYGFDVESLRPIASRVGPRPDDVLLPPNHDIYPQGDVHRPASVQFGPGLVTRASSSHT